MSLRDSLSNDEINKLDLFIKAVNVDIRQQYGDNQMSEKTALKFLNARKFDVERAIDLYEAHEIVRFREGLTAIDPNDDNLKEELASGKFTVLGTKDDSGATITIFTAKLHSPGKLPKNHELRRKLHHRTLQGLVYQLDSALEDLATQQNGIVFLYNMSQSDYSNFDYELCNKILNLLKGAFPAKLKKVLILSPPLWFRAPFHFLRLIIKEKLRHRVFLIDREQLAKHLPPSALTSELGGSYQHDHQAWIQLCISMYERFDDLCDIKSAQHLIESQKNKSSSRKSSRSPSIEADHNYAASPSSRILEDDRDKSSDSSKSNKSVTYDYMNGGLELDQFIETFRAKYEDGLVEEYESIITNDKDYTFHVSTSPMNMPKNRYFNIKCYDHTRVILYSSDIDEPVGSDPMDYINANYIDGYQQPRAYISTQGPLDTTVNDFWRMIWQTGSHIIVMVTQNIENGMEKCDRYWPYDGPMESGIYQIEELDKVVQEDYTINRLNLTKTSFGASREVLHFQFTAWPDFGVPQSASALLKFRERIMDEQLRFYEAGGANQYPPIVVHCSAGVGRSGTFITVDICIQKFQVTGKIDVRGVVEKLREQRFSSIQTKDQYIFCHTAVLEFASNCGLIKDGNLIN